LQELARLGAQIIDLESLAEHRGSLFGALAGRPQPSQKLFESRLLQALDSLDVTRPIIVEAESSKIGDRMTPPVLWRAMQTAPRVVLEAPQTARAQYLAAAYSDISADTDALEAAFDRLPVAPSRERRETWRGMIAAGAFADLAQALIDLHYDPAYDRAAKKTDAPVLARLTIEPAKPASRAATAQAIAEAAHVRFGVL
jgi:tRNA 2-selenouridine synthase